MGSDISDDGVGSDVGVGSDLVLLHDVDVDIDSVLLHDVEIEQFRSLGSIFKDFSYSVSC